MGVCPDRLTTSALSSFRNLLTSLLSPAPLTIQGPTSADCIGGLTTFDRTPHHVTFYPRTNSSRYRRHRLGWAQHHRRLGGPQIPRKGVVACRQQPVFGYQNRLQRPRNPRDQRGRQKQQDNHRTNFGFWCLLTFLTIFIVCGNKCSNFLPLRATQDSN